MTSFQTESRLRLTHWQYHAVGAVCCSVLVAATLYAVLGHPQPAPLSAADMLPISLSAAAELNSNATQLQRRHQELLAESLRIESDTQAARQWIPIHWQDAEIQRVVASSTQQHALELHHLKIRAAFHGTRVSVIACECKVEGSFADLCHWLQQIANAESPIWCQELHLSRQDSQGSSIKRPNAANPQSGASTFTATVLLRFPYCRSRFEDASETLDRQRLAAIRQNTPSPPLRTPS